MDQTHENSRFTVRVIIPAFRSGPSLRGAVEAVLNSKIERPLEVVIVDNGENEKLHVLLAGLDVVIVHDDRQHSAAYARTRGAAGMVEGILVFVDDDVLCESRCIERLIAPIVNGCCDATVGNYSSDISGLGFAQAFKQLYIHRVYSRRSGILTNEYWTAIGAIRADVFHDLRGFDTHFAGACGEDMDLGIRLTRDGYRIWSVPDAVGKHLHPFTMLSVLRNDFRKGMIAMYNLSRGDLPISKHRHSSLRDIGAVASAILFLAGLLFMLVSMSIGISLSVAGALTWLSCRADVLQDFWKYGGPLFGIKATLFMHVLDDLRAYCLFLGKWKYRIRRATQSKLRPINPTPNLTADSQ